MLMQVRDRQSTLSFCSRSARTVHNPQHAIAKECRNDFRICLETDHALDLLNFTFGIGGQHNTSPRRMKPVISPIKFRALQFPTRRFPGFQRCIRHVIECEQEDTVIRFGLISNCVVVDLCRPFEFALHSVSIYNADLRSHSDLSNDPSISILSKQYLHNAANQSESNDWRPRPPLEQSVNGPDFVTLTQRNGSKTHALCVEGVAVKATKPVAIRVELQNASAKWFAVDDGALLRPDTNALNFVTQSNRNESLQLIIFPEPFVNFLLHSARITIVECDGRGVRVGLLVSNSNPHDYERQFVRNSTPAILSDIFTDRTETFGTDEDYYNWWYRLQSVRTRLDRLSPLVHEAVEQLQKRIYDLDPFYLRGVRLQACCDEHMGTIVISSALVYATLLLIAFPIMMVLNLDQVAARHSSNTTNATNATTSMRTTTTSHYSMASPDPHRLMRTMCWWPSADMDKQVLAVPWSAVFLPFFALILLALTAIIGRLFNIWHARRQHRIRTDEYRRAEEESKICRQKVHARIEAKLLAEADEGHGVSNVVKAVVNEFVASSVPKPISYRPSIRQYPPCLKRHFLDSFALIIGLVGLVIYGVADWGCYFGDMDSQGSSVAVLCILAALCVVMDLVVGVQFVRFLLEYIEKKSRSNFDASPRSKILKVLIFVLFGVLILQQVFLLLEMFTFFHELSFFFVLLPLLVAIIIFNVIVVHYQEDCLCLAFTIPCVSCVMSAVLLMLKADNFFGVGTVSEGVAEWSWAVVMMPIWSVMGLVLMAVGGYYMLQCYFSIDMYDDMY